MPCGLHISKRSEKEMNEPKYVSFFACSICREKYDANAMVRCRVNGWYNLACPTCKKDTKQLCYCVGLAPAILEVRLTSEHNKQMKQENRRKNDE